jgi:hypothetical protein
MAKLTEQLASLFASELLAKAFKSIVITLLRRYFIWLRSATFVFFLELTRLCLASWPRASGQATGKVVLIDPSSPIAINRSNPIPWPLVFDNPIVPRELALRS